MKKTILALAIVASTIGAFAQQAPAKKPAAKVEHKAKKDTVAKVVTPKPAKTAKAPKAKKVKG